MTLKFSGCENENECRVAPSCVFVFDDAGFSQVQSVHVYTSDTYLSQHLPQAAASCPTQQPTSQPESAHANGLPPDYEDGNCVHSFFSLVVLNSE